MSTTTATQLRPRILRDGDTLTDLLAAYQVAEVKASNLKPGMILLDELDCACFVVDHRVPSVRNSGCARFLMENIDRGGWEQVSIHANKIVRVAAR